MDNNKINHNIFLTEKFSPELKLALSLSSQKTELLQLNSINWNNLISISKRHGLIPHYFYQENYLQSCVPQDIYEILKSIHINQVQYALNHTACLLKISDLLFKENIGYLWLKGPCLAQSLYGNVSSRSYVDIDLFIDINYFNSVNRILESLGFKADIEPGTLNLSQWSIFCKFRNQLLYFNRSQNIQLELHWQLLNPIYLFNIDYDNVVKNTTTINISNKQIPTLAKDFNFLFLSSHGAKHGWHKLSWLKDIDTIIRSDTISWEIIIDQARKYGLIRIINQTLLLANIIYESPIPAYFKQNKLTSKISYLSDYSILAMQKSQEELMLKGFKRFGYIIYLSRLKNNLRYKLNCFTKTFMNEEDWEKIRLPQFLFFIYFFIRPFTWFYREYLAKKKR